MGAPVGAASLLLTLLVLSGCGRTAARAGPQTSLGPMAGYVWEGHVTSVRGSWIVPRVASRSPDGRAGTWIGAQAPGLRHREPFIQVGVNEESRGRAAFYYAFWTDTDHHFAPIALFDVQAGDRISATLSLHHGRWTVAISDATAPSSRQFRTADEGRARFVEALWLQEDITNARTQHVFPYPTLSDLRWTGLKVNAKPPRYADVYAQWMSLPAGRDLAPTPLTGDRFTVHPAALGEPARRYLRLVAAEDAAEGRFESSVLRFTASTSPATIRAAATRFAATLSRGLPTVPITSWPASARPPMASLVAAQRALARVVADPTSGSARRLAIWRHRLRQAIQSLGDRAHLARRALRAPEYTG